MNDPLIMSVLDCAADRKEQFEPLRRRQSIPVAINRNTGTLNVVHHEERPAPRGGPCIEDPGDAGMLHARQSLAFMIESGQHLLRVHAQLHHLQSYAPADRFGLLGEVDRPHASFAEDSQYAIGAEVVPLGRFPRRCG